MPNPIQIDAHLELAGCEGEATGKYEGKIEVLDWHWRIENQGSGASGGGSGTGKAQFHDLEITKFCDKASNTLMENCSKGKHFATGKLYNDKAGGDDSLPYLVIEMDQVFISSVHAQYNPEYQRVTETVTLNMEKVNSKYQMQSASGSAEGDVPFKWDIKGNKQG